MKSRITTYVLVVAVVAVWGFVAWKLFFSRPETSVVPVSRSIELSSRKTEEDFLLLNYADPFLKNNVEMKIEIPIPAAQIEIKAQKPAIQKQKPPVKYAGTIVKKGKVAHVFEHAGLLHSLVPGESVGGWVLTNIFTDSVCLVKNEEKHIVYLQK